MQKVEGSSPFSRFARKPRSGGVSLCSVVVAALIFQPALPLGATSGPPCVASAVSVARARRADKGVAYRVVGYEPCDSAALQVGYEKIAIYADETQEPRHAARQLPNGSWTSKLGDHFDIEHADLAAISGLVYGEPVVFMRREAGPAGDGPSVARRAPFGLGKRTSPGPSGGDGQRSDSPREWRLTRQMIPPRHLPRSTATRHPRSSN